MTTKNKHGKEIAKKIYQTSSKLILGSMPNTPSPEFRAILQGGNPDVGFIQDLHNNKYLIDYEFAKTIGVGDTIYTYYDDDEYVEKPFWFLSDENLWKELSKLSRINITHRIFTPFEIQLFFNNVPNHLILSQYHFQLRVKFFIRKFEEFSVDINLPFRLNIYDEFNLLLFKDECYHLSPECINYLESTLLWCAESFFGRDKYGLFQQVVLDEKTY